MLKELLGLERFNVFWKNIFIIIIISTIPTIIISIAIKSNNRYSLSHFKEDSNEFLVRIDTKNGHTNFINLDNPSPIWKNVDEPLLEKEFIDLYDMSDPVSCTTYAKNVRKSNHDFSYLWNCP